MSLSCNNSIGSLPGPRRKQAEALTQNILWLARTFGAERIGFLTLTFADDCKSRAEASRRFNSALTNAIRRRYKCGVVVSERTKRGVIHFHLVVPTGADIRTGINFAECFPKSGRGNYRSAPEALRAEWAWLRENLHRYGFGRHQLQPMREVPEALAVYVGKYISKSWNERTDDDKGARLVRYFGRWTVGNAKCSPPWTARHGVLSPQARAWRECMKQVGLATKLAGIEITPQNARVAMGRRWAWNVTKRIRATEFFLPRSAHPSALKGLAEHHTAVAREHGSAARHIGHRPPEYWFHDWRDSEELPSHIHAGRKENAARIAEDNARREKVESLLESIGAQF